VSPGHGSEFAVPEMDAVFLCESLQDVEFFVGFGQHPLVDVWEVDARGLAIEPGTDGWAISRAPIGPERVRLLHADRPPEPREVNTVSLAFTSESLSTDEMTELAGIEPDDAGSDDGEKLGREPGTMYAWWYIAGSDEYAPLADQIDELVGRIAAAEDGLRSLAAEADEGRFVAYGAGSGRALSQEARALLDRLGVDIEPD
jgi:hypothetical protein